MTKSTKNLIAIYRLALGGTLIGPDVVKVKPLLVPFL